MNIRHLEAFVKIAETKSFSKAAKDMFLTQPTVSSHIMTLEKELNVKLLVRNTRGTSLTKEGEVLLQYAKQIIEIEHRITDTFNKDESKKSVITIGASTIPSQYLLPDILKKYNEMYTKEVFKIIEADSYKTVEQVENNMVDIGFTGTMIKKTNVKYVPFCKDELLIVTPDTKHYRKMKEEKNLNWILKEPIIIREQGSGTRREGEKQLDKLGIDIKKLNVIAIMENLVTIKRSVENNMGISLMSGLSVLKEVESGELLSINLPGTRRYRDMYMVYNNKTHISKVLERFMRMVKGMYIGDTL